MDKEIVLITGANSGFGFLTALKLAGQGYYVIATMRDLTKKDHLLDDAKKLQLAQQIEILQLDVTNIHEMTSIINYIEANIGFIDILINNAGYSQGGFVEQLSMREWEDQFNTNFFSAVALTRLVLPSMRKRRKGKIIFLGSISGRIGLPGMGPYAATKFALEGFCESLRLEVKPLQIYVSIIEAGAFQTNIWEKAFEKIGKPKEKEYDQFFEATFSSAKKSAKQSGDPAEVAELISRICNEKTPKLRYHIGKGVRRLILVKNILPWTIIEKMIHRKLIK